MISRAILQPPSERIDFGEEQSVLGWTAHLAVGEMELPEPRSRISRHPRMSENFDRAATARVERMTRVHAGHTLSRNAECDMVSAGEAVDALWPDYSAATLAALRTLREPSAVMLAVGDAEVWDRMIRAAPRRERRRDDDRLTARPEIAWREVAAYFSMYAFRKPFTAATHADVPGWTGMVDFKTALVIAQVAGYALSKFIGVTRCGLKS